MQEFQRYDDTVVCTDSQALLTSIESMSPDTQDIRNILDSLHGKTHLHWIPSHSNIPGNEYADRAAKEAAKLPEPEESPIPVSYGVAKAVVRAHIKDEDPEHHVVAETYKGYIRKTADRQISSRKEGALLAQLRSGHCLELAHYKNRMDRTKSSPRGRPKMQNVRRRTKQ